MGDNASRSLNDWRGFTRPLQPKPTSVGKSRRSLQFSLKPMYEVETTFVEMVRLMAGYGLA